MEGHSILRPTYFITIGTFDRPVIPDTCLGHPVIAFEFTPIWVQVISESKCVPNIFSVTVTPIILCRL